MVTSLPGILNQDTVAQEVKWFPYSDMANLPNCCCVRPSNFCMSPGEPTSHSSDSPGLFLLLSPKFWLLQPPNSSSPPSFNSFLPIVYTKIFQMQTSGHQIPIPISSLVALAVACLHTWPTYPNQDKVQTLTSWTLPLMAWLCSLLWPHLSSESPPWPCMCQWSETG